MKNILILLLFVSGIMISCESTDSNEPTLTTLEQFDFDLDIIDKYLADSSIVAEIDSLSELRYVIHNPGEGDSPSGSDNVTINFEGRFLSSGVVFDDGEAVTFPLNGLIGGWQIGLPLIKEGGSITLYIPSAYGYGTQGRGEIGPNSILEFDIDLIKVN